MCLKHATVGPTPMPCSKTGVVGQDFKQQESTDLTPPLLALRRSDPDVLLALTATDNDTGYTINQAAT